MSVSTLSLSNTFGEQLARINEVIDIINSFGTGADVIITGGDISGVEITDSTIEDTPIGQTTRRAGSFTTVELDNALSIANGGTGATSAGAAREAIGAHNASNLTTGTVDSARIPNLAASKITSGQFAVGSFGTNIALEVASAGEVSVKGIGNSTRYSSIVLGSDEVVDKEWRISHRQDTSNLFDITYQGTRVLSIDPSNYGVVLHSATGGSQGNGTINAKGFFKNGVDVASAANDTLPGLIEIATQTEVNTATDTTRAVVPARMKTFLEGTHVRPSFNGLDLNWTVDSNHPHGLDINSVVGGQVIMRLREAGSPTALIYSDGKSTWGGTLVVGNATDGFSVPAGSVNAKGFYVDGISIPAPFTSHVYTSNNTWNKPTTASFVMVECIGGGGGGGSANGNAGGGGGGGFSHRVFRAVDLPSSVSITVGAGGVGSPNAGTGVGTSGGFSSFGDFLRANGGSPGSNTSNGGVAGGGGEFDGGTGAGFSSIPGAGGCSKMGGGGGGSAINSTLPGSSADGGRGYYVNSDYSNTVTGGGGAAAMGVGTGNAGTSRSGYGAGDGGGARAGAGGTVTGGAGGIPGGGGGGGGGSGSGARVGGAGGRGEVRVYVI